MAKNKRKKAKLEPAYPPFEVICCVSCLTRSQTSMPRQLRLCITSLHAGPGPIVQASYISPAIIRGLEVLIAQALIEIANCSLSGQLEGADVWLPATADTSILFECAGLGCKCQASAVRADLLSQLQSLPCSSSEQQQVIMC